MIRYVKLENFMSFTDVCVDFMKNKSKIKSTAIIYGENSSGKTNLATSFHTLYESIRTLSASKDFNEIMNRYMNGNEDLHVYNELKKMFSFRYKDTAAIIDKYKTIDSEENMVLEFGISLKGKNSVYHIEYNSEEIVKEFLELENKKSTTTLFYIDAFKENVIINKEIYKDETYNDEIINYLEKYWGKHSLMSVFNFEESDKKRGYLKSKMSKSFIDILYYLESICTKVKESTKEYGFIDTKNPILSDLEEGRIKSKEEKMLIQIEFIVNEIFTKLYSDVKKAYYKKKISDNTIEYSLYLKKRISGKIIDIPFSRESQGTSNLLNLLPYIIAAIEGKTVVIDEIDSGIHDILLRDLFKNISDYLTNGQLIITTHNTLLLESMIPKENIYVIQIDKDTRKRIVPITNEGRIEKNVNPRKKYLSGAYKGIPIIHPIDFDKIMTIFLNKNESRKD